jgi:hypothetical protein
MPGSTRRRVAFAASLISVLLPACHSGGVLGHSTPTICPLSGLAAPSGTVPDRPALAIKVENLPQSRPQTGLSWADIVYEEPVEARITRFIAVYQCRDASRVEPVRSARFTDPPILVQLGRPLFAYAGGVPQVVQKIRKAGLIDLSFNNPAAAPAYHRDPARSAPHNLYTSTAALFRIAHRTGRPDPLFTYTRTAPTGRPATEIHLPFSSFADVIWRWDASRHTYMRWHGTEPHTLSDGTQVSTANVVVQVVKLVNTDIRDANGVVSPEVVSVGSGKAYVFRGGRVVPGTWSRPSAGDVTIFRDAKGGQIPLTPGQTWVELFPSDTHLSFS